MAPQVLEGCPRRTLFSSAAPKEGLSGILEALRQKKKPMRDLPERRDAGNGIGGAGCVESFHLQGTRRLPDCRDRALQPIGGLHMLKAQNPIFPHMGI